MTQGDKIRSYPLDMPPSEVARRVGVKSGAVVTARKRTGKRGRPRKTVHPAEACALYLDAAAEATRNQGEAYMLEDLATAIRSGAWKVYAQPVVGP